MEATATATGSVAGDVVIEGVRQVYPGGTVALDGIDLTVGRGLFGLLGPNGAGKSTLMKILCTLLVPTAGRASVLGHDVVADVAGVRRQLGYLPQEFGGWRLQRVEEVLDTLGLLSGMLDRGERSQRIGEVLEQVGLASVARRKVKKLSGGMVRRLGVAQALLHGPRILIVDEPTVGLDPEERLRFRNLMADLARDRTIVLSTHIVADLGSGCRDLALLAAGKVVFRGTPEQLLARARGKVFEITVGVGGEERLGPEVEIVARSRDGVGTRLRGVAHGALPSGADAVSSPTLEEAYLAVMSSHGVGVEALVNASGEAAAGAGSAGAGGVS